MDADQGGVDLRHRALRAARPRPAAAEQHTMLAYQRDDAVRMRFLRDPSTIPAPRTAGAATRCTGVDAALAVAPHEVARVGRFLRAAVVVLEPRKQWPPGLERRGNIKAEVRAEEGRALAFGTDPGWSEILGCSSPAPTRHRPTSCSTGVAATLKAWPWGAPGPPGSPGSRPGDARCWWRAWPPGWPRWGRWSWSRPCTGCGPTPHRRPAWTTRPPRRPTCSTPSPTAGPTGRRSVAGLLIDDAARSGWTLAVVAEGLRSAGSGLVLPFVLWRRP